MIPPHKSHLHFGFEMHQVQRYIQARLPTEDPYMLHVNTAQADEYYDELQHYIQQKNSLRRPRAPSQPQTPPQAPPSAPRIPSSTSDRSCVHQTKKLRPQSASSVHSAVPKRLPAVAWLLSADSQPRRSASPPLPSAHVVPISQAFPSHPARHRVLKKQKTM